MYAPNYILVQIIMTLGQTFPDESVEQWFDKAKVLALTEDTLILYSPYLSSHQQILEKCVPYMTDVLNQLLECNAQLLVWGDKEVQENLFHKSRSICNDTIFTFEDFVVGDSNLEAVTLARSVVNQDGCQFVTPLLIYGPSGVGKTHLLQAIKHSINISFPGKVVRYLTAERFTAELIWSLQQGEYDKFIQQYRLIDLLLIDDLQFLSGKEATQAEFLRILGYLYQQKRHVVITSNCPPSNIPLFNDYMKNRLASINITSIAFPGLDILYPLATRLTQKYKLPLDQSKIRYLTESCPRNVRHLSGVFKKLRAANIIDDMELTLENIDRVIASYQ